MRSLKTFETEIVVRADRTAVVAAKLPDEVPAGKYRAVVLIEDRAAADSVAAVAGLPPLRWEGPLLVYDGTLLGALPEVLDELRRERLDDHRHLRRGDRASR